MEQDIIRVEFINAIDDSVISISEAPAERLPDTFEQPITMKLKGANWSVEEATPIHARDFRKTKHLVLRLRKLEIKAPKELMFSMPTISKELPEVTAINPYPGVPLSIREDEWRQHEFLNKSTATLIKVECDIIEDIRQHHSKKVKDIFTSYSKCHTRSSIGSPNLTIELSDLVTVMGIEAISGLNLVGTKDYVRNGFAFSTAKSMFYGISEKGLVSELCITNVTEGTKDEIQAVIGLSDVVYVDWCSGVMEWKLRG